MWLRDPTEPRIRLNPEDATKIIAQRLRDDAGLQPQRANSIADSITRALQANTPAQTKPRLSDYRLIGPNEPVDLVSELIDFKKKAVVEADYR
jgi:hypothetical protein